MPQLALITGVGARFFHPSTKIRAKLPQNNKRHLLSMLVTGKGIQKVQHKSQMCYLVRIPKINDSTIFHIVKKNFKVLSARAIPFESEVPTMSENPLPHHSFRARR